MRNAHADTIKTNAATEKNLITRLDGTLNQDRTPYLKAQLRLTLSNVDDVDMLLRFEQQAQPRYAGAWLAIAEGNVARAAATCQQVQKLVDAYGGPDNVIEVGGR